MARAKVGELERKAYEERKNFARKANKIAKMIVRIVTFEGSQPMVTEATTFMKGIDQCTVEVEDANRNWKSTIVNDHCLRFCGNDLSNVEAMEIC